MRSIIKITLIIVIATLSHWQSYGQARSSIGLAYGINKPLTTDFKTGSGFNLQSSIRVSNKVAITPSLGYEKLNANFRNVYDSYGYRVYSVENIGLVYLGVGAKYYFKERFFARAGAMLYLGGGNEDLVTGGVGGALAAGYELMLDRHSDLEFTLRTDLINLRSSETKITPVIGLKVAYNFNFRRLL
ncbi:hypothetical protein GCM10023149_18810 [Mucilaginibacter gynuensis]|uniref:Outer membrane protein beta-barrel domain-containing protein n=1 Tax=Mucilaginibacter gynuensis TaxID=1302236 RepID=A0ABP8G9D8_9SPHI